MIYSLTLYLIEGLYPHSFTQQNPQKIADPGNLLGSKFGAVPAHTNPAELEHPKWLVSYDFSPRIPL
jgi:hypothetical protein